MRWEVESASIKPLEKSAPADGRAAVSPWLPKGLLKSTADKPAWRWERMTAADGDPREDDDWNLFDRSGKMVARVRQEGNVYWVARPRIIPEPPIESFEAACRRAVQVAMLTLAWPESEKHATHPGMTASQFDATRRDLSSKHIVGILKPSTRDEGCVIKRHHPPVNILGGYKFPDAPVVENLSPGSSNDGVAPQSDNVTIPSPANSAPQHLLDQIPDDLSIPDFLRRGAAA